MSVFKQNEAALEMHEIEGKVVNGHSAQNSGLTDGDLPGFGPENGNHGNGAVKRRIGPQHSICGMIMAAPGQTVAKGHERIFSEAESLYGAGEQYNEQIAVLPGNTTDDGNGDMISMMMMKGMEYGNAAQPLTTNGMIARPSTTMGNRDKRGSTKIIGDDFYLRGTKASKRTPGGLKEQIMRAINDDEVLQETAESPE